MLLDVIRRNSSPDSMRSLGARRLIQAQRALAAGAVRTVAGKTAVGEDGADIAIEGNPVGTGGGERCG